MIVVHCFRIPVLGRRVALTASASRLSFRCARQIESASRTAPRSEEHTSELQSRLHLVCRLLLEKKKELIHLWLRGWRSAFEVILLIAAIYYGYLYFHVTRGATVLTGLAIVSLTLTLVLSFLHLI